MLHPEISRSEEIILRWQYLAFLGASHFEQALIDVIKFADQDNLERIELAFPEEVAGFKSYWFDKSWWEKLQNRAIGLGVLSLQIKEELR